MKNDSKFSKFIFRYFFITDIESLSIKEKIGITFVSLLFPNIMLIFLYLMNPDLSVLMLLCGVNVLLLGACCPLLFYDKLKRKYAFYSDVRFGATYQSIARTFSYLIPGLIIIILTVGWILDNVTMSILISFAFVLPFLALFFRIDVFNDDSSIEGDKIILGYHPTYYGLLSLMVGIYGYFKCYSLLNHDFNISIFVFCITFIFQTMFLIPDKINKHLSFELRQTKGFLIYMTLLVITFLIISSLVSNTPIIDLNYIDLSFESIIRLIITWGVGIGLVILFVRKIKKMAK